MSSYLNPGTLWLLGVAFGFMCLIVLLRNVAPRLLPRPGLAKSAMVSVALAGASVAVVVIPAFCALMFGLSQHRSGGWAEGAALAAAALGLIVGLAFGERICANLPDRRPRRELD